MKKKILFTGNARVLIDDLMSHAPTAYQCYKCIPSEMEFLHALEKYQPDVVVIALFKETSTMLRMYAELKDRKEYIHLPLIAIGSEEDCRTFQRSVFQKHIACFERPVDTEEYTKKLDEFSVIMGELAQEKEEREKSLIKAPEIERPVRKVAEKKEAESRKKNESMSNESERKTILVVDDDVRMLNLIKAYLEDLYDVVVVPSGKLALKYLLKKRTDLVLLDYMMPEMDGPEVLKMIRENESCCNLPVIFLTGVSDKDKVMEGLLLRPDGYILKPSTRETILERVTETLLGL